MISNNSPNFRWVILLMLLGVQLVSSMVAFGWGALAPSLKELMSLNNMQVGIISSTFFIASGLSAFPGGIFVDRYGVKKSLLFSLWLVGFPLLFLGLVYSRHVVFLAMVAISGFGYGMSSPVGTKGLFEWFDVKTRGTAFGIRQASVPVGGAAAGVLLVYVCQKIGSFATFRVLGLMIVVMAMLAFYLYRTPERDGSIPVEKNHAKNNRLPKTGFRGFFKNKALLVIFAIVGVMGLQQGVIVTFFLVFVNEGLGYSLSAAGFLLATLMISGAVGRVFWGIVSDSLFNGGRKPVLIIISALITLSVVMLACWSRAWPQSLFFLVVIVIGLSTLGWNAVALVLVVEVSEGGKAGSSSGFAMGLGWVGMVVGTLSFGALTDYSGYYHAWMFLVAFSLLSLTLCLLLPGSKKLQNSPSRIGNKLRLGAKKNAN